MSIRMYSLHIPGNFKIIWSIGIGTKITIIFWQVWFSNFKSMFGSQYLALISQLRTISPWTLWKQCLCRGVFWGATGTALKSLCSKWNVQENDINEMLNYKTAKKDIFSTGYPMLLKRPPVLGCPQQNYSHVMTWSLYSLPNVQYLVWSTSKDMEWSLHRRRICTM